MKSVLISIQPRWCELIRKCIGYENRRPLYKKRLDLRKSAPEATPFKAFIYETQGRAETPFVDEEGHYIFKGRRQVIGEFICDYVVRHCEMANADLAEEMSCVPREDILKYSNGKEVFGWHISSLVIYKKPRELWEFKRECKEYGSDNPNCTECNYYISGMCYEYDESDCGCSGKKPITRPPQSWCYVESEDAV